VADAYFKIGAETVQVFGPRAEQVAHLLELDGDRKGNKLADRIGSHVADAEAGEPVLELDEDERQELLSVLDRIAAASRSFPEDLEQLRGALRD
jgi:hypothetical protein